MSSATAPSAWRARLGHGIGVVLFHTLYDGRTRHAGRVPREGPVVLVANHAAFLDGPAAFSLAPRSANFLVKQEAFTGFFGWLIEAVGQIPIDRSIGDRTALGTAIAVLDRGGVVGVFPEGTRRDGDVEKVNQGAAWIAMRTGARIVPVAVLGTRVPGGSPDAWPRPRSALTVDFGAPFELAVDRSVPGRDRLRLATEQLRDHLASHVRTARVDNDGASPPADSRTL